MLSENDDILLIQYLSSELSDNEVSDLETRLLSDLDLQVRLNQYQQIIAFIKLQGRTDFKEQLDQYDRKNFKEKNSGNSNWKLWSIAASLLILVAAYFFFQPKQIPDRDYFAAYYEVYPNMVNPTFRSETTIITDKDFKEMLSAIKLYENKDYDSAITVFNKLPTQLKQTDTVLFYQGLSHFYLKDFSEVTKLLGQLKGKESPFLEPANWYLAISYLELRDRKLAIENLEAVSNSKKFGKRANEILKSVQ